MKNQPSLPAGRTVGPLGAQERTRQEVSTALGKFFVLVLGTLAPVDGNVAGVRLLVDVPSTLAPADGRVAGCCWLGGLVCAGVTSEYIPQQEKGLALCRTRGASIGWA